MLRRSSPEEAEIRGVASITNGPREPLLPLEAGHDWQRWLPGHFELETGLELTTSSLGSTTGLPTFDALFRGIKFRPTRQTDAKRTVPSGSYFTSYARLQS
jgi:hypothetical protein